jgi:hypothetical protein
MALSNTVNITPCRAPGLVTGPTTSTDVSLIPSPSPGFAYLGNLGS